MIEPKKWEIKNKRKSSNNTQEIINILLKNRGIGGKKEKEEFFNPTHPLRLSLKSLKIDSYEVVKAIKRIKVAIEKKEMIVVYGDYDVDGICGSAIVFEILFALKAKVHPHLPDRFLEGYGLRKESVEKLKKEHPDLGVIITVDNGISALEAVEAANDLGVDVIITDHHSQKAKNPKSFATIYTKEIGGAQVAWIFAREIRKKLKVKDRLLKRGDGLELAALGVFADQLPLIGHNRSFAFWGIKALRQTVRPGLLALFREAAIAKDSIGSYEINYMIAPRLNAAGRLEQALDSLRLVCTTLGERGEELARHLGTVNARRQKILEEIYTHARGLVSKKDTKKILVLSHKGYHEGVIGLAASKLVEEFHRPAVVISVGEKEAKGSGRSIPGFNLFEAIQKVEGHLTRWGGHSMAAGFSLPKSRIKVFKKQLEKVSESLLTNDILARKLKVDTQVSFDNLNFELYEHLSLFEPTGIGNPAPTFYVKGAKVLNARLVGRDSTHLKLLLGQKKIVFDAIAFGQGGIFSSLSQGKVVEAAFILSEDTWGNTRKLQLKIKDIRVVR